MNKSHLRNKNLNLWQHFFFVQIAARVAMSPSVPSAPQLPLLHPLRYSQHNYHRRRNLVRIAASLLQNKITYSSQGQCSSHHLKTNNMFHSRLRHSHKDGRSRRIEKPPMSHFTSNRRASHFVSDSNDLDSICDNDDRGSEGRNDHDK